MSVATRVWSSEERDLWDRVAAHSFADPTIALDFTRRLARQMGWSLEAAHAAIEEYRRFCFLAVVSATPVTPSEEVDEVWHLHLTYTRDYWERWCKGALRRSLHHDPTAGGAAERSRFQEQYADTLALYEANFGAPDARFWPGLQSRFRAKPRYRLIDADRQLAVPRPSLDGLRRARLPGIAALLSLAAGTSASAAPLADVLDWPADQFLTFYVLLLVCAFAVALLLRSFAGETRKPADSRNLSSLEVAYLSGGIGRAADTLYLELATRGAARTSGSEISVSAERADLPPDLQPFRYVASGKLTRREFVAMFKGTSAASKLREGALARNLVQSGRRRVLSFVATATPLVPVLLLGMAKVAVGVSRHKPVGYLLALIGVGLVGLLYITVQRRWLTQEGRDALAAFRERNERAVRAPREREVPLAFAVLGAAALAGTSHSSYAALLNTNSKDGGSGCGSGCGGGGCGGCSG